MAQDLEDAIFFINFPGFFCFVDITDISVKFRNIQIISFKEILQENFKAIIDESLFCRLEATQQTYFLNQENLNYLL